MQLDPTALGISIRTADAGARGRAWFGVDGDRITARTELIDRRALRQYRALVLLTLVAWLVPLGVGAVAAGHVAVPDAVSMGFPLGLVGWAIVVLVGQVWLGRYRVVHTTVFSMRDVAAVDMGRDWGIGCALAILLTPLIALIYLVAARGRVIRVAAPLAADRAGPVALRLKGSELEGLALRRMLLGPYAG